MRPYMLAHNTSPKFLQLYYNSLFGLLMNNPFYKIKLFLIPTRREVNTFYWLISNFIELSISSGLNLCSITFV